MGIKVASPLDSPNVWLLDIPAICPRGEWAAFQRVGWNCMKVMVQKVIGLSLLSLLAGSFSRARCVSFTYPEAGLLPPLPLQWIRG